MDAHEFQQLVAHIRDSLEFNPIGLTSQEITALRQRLDSDAYAAAKAVDEFFELKRQGLL